MIPTDADLVLLQHDSYAAAPAGEVIDCGPDRVVLTRMADCIVITVRGTANPLGWWSDFQIAAKIPRGHPQIGVCEDGFLTGAEALFDALLCKLPRDKLIVLQGHSRGAPIAAQIAGLLVVYGLPPVRCVCWEKPWGNGPLLRAMLAQAGVAGIEYWHGDDSVPLAPAVPWLVMANFPIRHFGRWTVDPFASHLMAGIVTDVAAGALAA